MDPKSIFIYFTIYLTLLPLGIGLFYFKKTDPGLKLLLVYLALSFFVDQIALQYFLKSVYNMLYINLFVLFEKCLFIYLLYYWNLSGKKRRLDFFLLELFIIALWTYYAFFTHTATGKPGIYNQLNVFGTLTSAIIVILAAVSVIRIVEVGSELFKNPVFWSVTAIFIYAAISLIVISTVFLMPKNAWSLFLIANIIYYLFLTKAFLVAGNSKQTRYRR